MLNLHPNYIFRHDIAHSFACFSNYSDFHVCTNLHSTCWVPITKLCHLITSVCLKHVRFHFPLPNNCCCVMFSPPNSLARSFMWLKHEKTFFQLHFQRLKGKKFRMKEAQKESTDKRRRREIQGDGWGNEKQSDHDCFLHPHFILLLDCKTTFKTVLRNK
jgi:hypothetical protein